MYAEKLTDSFQIERKKVSSLFYGMRVKILEC